MTESFFFLLFFLQVLWFSINQWRFSQVGFISSFWKSTKKLLCFLLPLSVFTFYMHNFLSAWINSHFIWWVLLVSLELYEKMLHLVYCWIILPSFRIGLGVSNPCFKHCFLFNLSCSVLSLSWAVEPSPPHFRERERAREGSWVITAFCWGLSVLFGECI